MEFENSTNIIDDNRLIIDINETVENISFYNYENIRAIILGFNDIKRNHSSNSSNISYFDIYFITLNKKFVSIFMKIPINIKYKNNLRYLENENNNYNPSACFITKEYKKNRASCLIANNIIEN